MRTEQAYTTLDNGIASFGEASDDYNLAPIGIASMPDQTERLAEFGRNGDIYIVHASEGETVVPREVLDANPQVKELLFAQMRGMDLDPQRYVVGNELNSINPVTGAPEFFFKKIFSGIKKAAKSAFKILKKAAPIILPIAASVFGVPFLPAALFGPGSFGAAALGGFFGNLAGGKSIKESIKGGLISGGISTLSSGIMGALGEGSFMEGVSSNLYDANRITPAAQFGKIFNTGASTATGTAGTVAPEALSPVKQSPVNMMDPTGASVFPVKVDPVADLSSASNVASAKVPLVSNLSSTSPEQRVMEFAAEPGLFAKATSPSDGPLSSFGRFLPEWVPGAKQNPTAEAVLGAAGFKSVANVPKAVYEQAARVAEAASTGTIARYGPLALGAAWAGGLFDPEEQPTLAEIKAQLPGVSTEEAKALREADLKLPPNKRRYSLPLFALNPYRGAIERGEEVPSQALALAAEGGPIMKYDRGGRVFPRRELLVEGPGTGRSDDVPAMLSDGEFVVTARGVRGADPSGRGNRYAGARNLYNIMRNFEMRA